NFFSSGGGRYIANTNLPDFVVLADQSLSKVKTWSGIYGAEATVHNSLVYGDYSLAHADENIAFDTNGTTRIRFGVPNTQPPNHKLTEGTVGLTQTFFRDPKIGGMQLMLQFSRVERTPFSVPVGTPSSAKTNMLYLNVRYLLP